MNSDMDPQDDFTRALKHLTDDAPVDQALLYGLSLMSKTALAGFETIWPGIKAKRRLIIMQKLVDITEISFEVNFDPIFILGLDDPDPEVQATAIEGLWEMESSALVPPLIHLMKVGKTVQVRAKAATALGQYIYLGELEEIDDSVAMLTEQALLETIRRDDEDVEVIRRAVESVSFSSSEAITKIIERAYSDNNENMQASAIFAMGRNYNPDKWEIFVIDELDNPNPAIRFEAARACGELQLDKSVKSLIKLIEEDTVSEIQQNAIWSLGQIGGHNAQAKLETLCLSSDAAIRTVAEEALDELLVFSNIAGGMFDFNLEDNLEDNTFRELGNDSEDYETFHLN